MIRWTQAMDDQLGEYIDQGLSAGKTAKLMGFKSRSVAHGRAFRLGWGFGRPRTPAEIEAAAALKAAHPKPKTMRISTRLFSHTLHVDCDDEMYAAVKARAAADGTTIAELLRCFIEWGLDT